MKNKRTKLIFAVVFVLLISFLLMTNVRAEITQDGNTITVPCGEEVSSYVEIDDWIDTTGRATSMNQYSILSSTGTQIFARWNNPMNNNPANENYLRSYYGRMVIDSSNVGQQTITIRFTPNNSNPAIDTTLTVNCTGSDNLKTVIEALGGSMPDAQTLNTDDAYTSLDGLTGDQYEAILDAADAYDALNDAEKAIVDNLLFENLDMTMDDVQQAADDGIEALANDFVDSSRLNDESVTDLHEARDILENALTLGDEFDALSPRTQARVLAKLDSESWDDVEEECRIGINIIDSDLFLADYIDKTDGTLDEDKILAGEETWNNLNDAVRGLINDALMEDEEIGETYPELLKKAKANKFLADYLATEDGKVIVEANNNNYKQILDAKDAYDALDDAVKEEVNKILTELGNTTYPQLLLDAQALAPTPKTGDVVVIAMVALLVSSLGIAATFIKKKK